MSPRTFPLLALRLIHAPVVVSLLLLASRSAGQVGDVVRVERGPDQATVYAEGGAVRIEFPAPAVVRLHASRDGRFPEDTLHPDFNGPYYRVDYSHRERIHVAQLDAAWRIEPIDRTGCLVVVESQPFRVRVFRRGAVSDFASGDGDAVAEIPGGALRFREGRAAVSLSIVDGEHLIGFGAHRHPLDMRGEEIVLRTSELGKEGEGGGFPVPWVMSSRGYGLFLNNIDPTTRFDVGKSDPSRLLIDAGDGHREGWDLDMYVIVGDGFPELMAHYIQLVGAPILPEKWFYGNLQSKCCDWRADEVVAIASRFRRLGLPLDGMILDLQWREIRPDDWNWSPAFNYAPFLKNRNLRWAPDFGDVPGMFRALDSLGVKLGLHENTTTTYSDDVDGAGPYLAASFPDTSKVTVAERLWAMHRPLIADGADFWWQDQGERIDARGANGYPMQNLSGALWAKEIVEGMKRERHVSVPVLARSGPVGGHRYIAPWPGDVPAGLRFATFDLDYIRNGGLAGFATIGADMGGFYYGHTPDPQNEVRRICDMLLVFPVIRTHGTYYKLPWMFSTEARGTYARYLQLRYRLMPYLYSAAIEAHETGRPILAPLCFDYGADGKTYARDFDFLLGHDLLVAPVVEAAETRDVYLPAGQWRDFWSDRPYAGGAMVTVPAPLEGDRSLPIFVKSGAVVPAIEPTLSIPEAFFDGYSFHVYPAAGESVQREFKDRARSLGESRSILVQVKDSPDWVQIRIEAGARVKTLYLHGVSRPAKVTVNAIDLAGGNSDSGAPGWTFGHSDFPLQGETVVLKVRLPELAPGEAIECRIAK